VPLAIEFLFLKGALVVVCYVFAFAIEFLFLKGALVVVCYVFAFAIDAFEDVRA